MQPSDMSYYEVLPMEENERREDVHSGFGGNVNLPVW
jgi:hypothetical protein